MSKGSGRRPQQAPDDQVQDAWDRIWGKKGDQKLTEESLKDALYKAWKGSEDVPKPK